MALPEVVIKKIDWSEKLEANEQIRYSHVIGKTALGDFEITWKSWKKSPSFTIEGEFFGYIADEVSLDAAKGVAETFYETIVMRCLEK